jgi:RHS repeat-associated protein
VATLGYGMTYRAFGALKSMTFGDHQTLSTSYDNRMRPTSWNVSNVLGYNYSYLEHTERVNYARNVYDGTLDRSYEYDQVGALLFAHSGAEARAAFGIDGTLWGNSDGPYSHRYDYDQHGNMIRRFGWGGEVQGGSRNGGDTTLIYNYSTNKNQRDGLGYDAAGNVTYDGYYNTYNVSNQQILAESGSYILAQYYDGDGLRVTKYDNGPTTNYLRSTVLGGAVVLDINANNNSAREYVYAGSDLLAVQSGGQVNWVHEDPITKSQRVTDASGNVINTIELDPWGANTNRSSALPFQPQTFTTYIRDGNGQQDAMARRYSVGGRFSQPDPYGGSYNFADPQSFNRYAYVGGDPVNRRDPSGLDKCQLDNGQWVECGTFDSSNTITINSKNSSPPAINGFFGSGTEGMMIEVPSDPQNQTGGGFGGNPFIARQPNDTKVFGNVLTACSTAGSVGEYSNVANGMWRGANGEWYRMGWGGNGTTAGRSIATRTASGFRVLGRVAGVAGMGISGYQAYNAFSQGNNKAGAKYTVDFVMGGVGTFGGPYGAAAGVVYFGVDATVGWDRVGREVSKCGPDCQYRTRVCSMASK